MTPVTRRDSDEEMISEKCPLCNETNPELINTVPLKHIVEAWEQAFGIDVSASLDSHEPMSLFKCNACGLSYFAPDDLAGSAELYSRLEEFEWYYLPEKWEHEIALAELRGGQSVLEIGCGFGDFLARARDEIGSDVLGIELNASAVEKARLRGVPVHLMDLEEAAAQWPGRFDVVCSFQVLEHVPNPRMFLEWTCALVKPGGRIILGLPNAESFLRHQFNLLEMPPHHMTRWSRDVLLNLPNVVPMAVDRIKFEPLADYHIDFYVSTYMSLARRFFRIQLQNQPRLEELLGKALRKSGIGKFLIGHTLYASFVRL